MMDYLEETKRLLRVADSGESEDDTGPSAKQIVATRAVASALVALTEHLTAFGTGAAMRREIDKLAIKSDVQEERLGEVVEALRHKADDGVFKGNVGQLQIEIEVINERLENLARGLDAIEQERK